MQTIAQRGKAKKHQKLDQTGRGGLDLIRIAGELPAAIDFSLL
ncbi:hypothetical protein Q0M94_06655 [Deinococcus radiomollis]